jgi:hypothetical protein
MSVVPDSVTLKDALPLIGVVIGAVIGGVGSFCGSYCLENSKFKREKRNVALAFAGEIAALRRIVELRHYVQGIENTLQHIRQTREPFYLFLPITREYFNVYNQNVSRIGVLDDPLPRLIAVFYTQGNAILEDFHGMTTGALEGRDIDWLIVFYKQLLELLPDTLDVGDEILAEVRRRYG